MVYGVGWTQRWQVPEGSLSEVEHQIERVGRHETGHLTVIDPGSGEPTTLVLAWRHVAAAIVLNTEGSVGAPDMDTSGQYR
jgi:hypothetical protein